MTEPANALGHAITRRAGAVVMLLVTLLAGTGCCRYPGSLVMKELPIDGHHVTSNDGGFDIVWASRPESIPLNEEFDLVVSVTPVMEGGAGDAEIILSIDARMPEHRHGMIQRPVVRRGERGLFQVEGMLFHMPGHWQIHFDITLSGVTERAQDDIDLE